jgi:phosphate-selective porin OprO/OprP
MLDLNDRSVRGGKERNVTLGINWYITSRVRLMADSLVIFNDATANDNGTVIGDDDPVIFLLQLQFRF